MFDASTGFVSAAVRVTALAVAALAAPAAAGAAAIAIEKFKFVPAEVTVAPGTRVVWINRDETPHTIAGRDGALVSKALDTGDAFEHTFGEAGDYVYFCTLHPFMTGTIHVRGR